MSAASSWPVPTSPHLHRSFYSEFATAQVMFVPKWCVAVVLAWLVHVSSGLPAMAELAKRIAEPPTPAGFDGPLPGW
ncbi:hypothetical protein SCLCIDRAFT_21358 [Scleroderma citrinum Foug A]|uniref:Uncharacterized protein n=1 Tax=Scleroderma citrinum Foug A TaxID=1036808 RepID=A0A0C3EFA8_9AGAM|nr:hypothetical protein SCLCIDRAFT_21358 [Scleroderma citrinum Foug A]